MAALSSWFVSRVIKTFEEPVYWLVCMLRYMYEWVFVTPLRNVYLHGYGWGVWGGWAGAPKHHICATLSTGSEPEFWTRSIDAQLQCESVIEKRFQSILIVIQCISLVAVLLKCFMSCFYYYTVVRPCLVEIRHLTGSHRVRSIKETS